MPLAEKTVTLPSGKQVFMREITSRESLTVDDYVGASVSTTRAYKTYAICSVRRIDNDVVSPTSNEIEFNATVDKFSLADVGVLVREWMTMSNEVASAADPKDSPDAPASSESQEPSPQA